MVGKGSMTHTFFCLFSEPSGVAAPLVGDIDSRTANVWWERPTQPNGILTQYNLYQNNVARDEVCTNSKSIPNLTLSARAPS